MIDKLYDWLCWVGFLNSLLGLLQALNDQKLRAGIRIHPGTSLVTRTRNEGMIDFLKNESFTHLFWIDSDIGFKPEAVFRLLRADRDVVAGAYPVKRIHWPEILPPVSPAEFFLTHLRYPVNAVTDGKPMSLMPDADGLLEVSEAPTGFMCIKRHVFDQMKKVPGMKYVPDMKPDDPNYDWCYRFFDVTVEPQTGRYLSEDYTLSVTVGESWVAACMSIQRQNWITPVISHITATSHDRWN